MILTRTYERDYSGLVTKINRPGGRYTRYCYDKLGRVIRADYYDKTYENFTYDKNGALIEAENQYGKVKFERDSLGRITKEWQGRHWISNQYNELGNCIQTVSSFGANILIRYPVPALPLFRNPAQRISFKLYLAILVFRLY